MTPKDFYARYKNLSASVTGPDGNPATVSGLAISRYVINSQVEPVMVPDKNDPTKQVQAGFAPKAGSPVDLIAHALQGIHDAFGQYLKRATAGDADVKNATDAIALSNVLSSYTYLRIPIGKGTPDDMENVLKAGLICGKIIVYGPPRPSQYVAADFAKRLFGIDCTGFVNAYFFTEGKTNAADVVSNWWDVGCPLHYSYAMKHGKQVFWTPQEIAANRAGAIVVWMVQTKGGGAHETRTPGHISLVNEVMIDGDGATLDCYESNGGTPYDDPRNTMRVLTKVVEDSTGKYWLTSGGEKVLVIRPFL
jgi:hypothetical protein